MGEQFWSGGVARSSSVAQRIWDILCLYFSIPLCWDVWEKRGNAVWWVGLIFEDTSGIESQLCDPARLYNVSEPHVCHV